MTHGYGVLSFPPVGETIFVKLLPLTAVEQLPKNRHSTANLFELPTHYQYRIGGCGFGAWRELEVHRLATEWVLSGQCPQFPLLYGWRTLPIVSPVEADKLDLNRWGNDQAVGRRVKAISESTQAVVLFLEHFPQNLAQSLQTRLRSKEDPLVVAEDTETQLRHLLDSIHALGLMHMDVHFENVLTDGSQLFLSDFGLAISRTFDLGEEEREFMQRHRNFDLATAIMCNVHAVLSRWSPEVAGDWRKPLRAFANGSEGSLDAVPERLREYLAKRTPLVLATGDFHLLVSDLTTKYSTETIQRLLDSI